MHKFKMTEKQEQSVTKAAQKLFSCDAARLVNYTGPQYFLVIGNYRNTRNDLGQWYKNGEPIHFRYLSEMVIASAATMTELLREMKRFYKDGGRAPSKGKQEHTPNWKEGSDGNQDERYLSRRRHRRYYERRRHGWLPCGG